MKTVLDNLLVGLALLVSVGYAVSSLGPKTWRNRWLAALSRLAERAPSQLRLGGVARRLAAAAAIVKPQGACGGCDNCGAESAAAPRSAAAEVTVPVANITRR
jgi:hypothetical protein